MAHFNARPLASLSRDGFADADLHLWLLLRPPPGPCGCLFRIHATQRSPIPWPSFIGITIWRHWLKTLSLVPHYAVNMRKSTFTHCPFSVICWKHCFEFLQHAWSGVDTTTTWCLRGNVQQHELLIPIDSGSSHNFTSDIWQPRLSGVQSIHCRLAVKVDNGQTISCPHHLPGAEWFISCY